MPELHLTRGGVALIDECDWDVCSQFHWRLTSEGYAARSIRRQEPKPWQEHMYLHRFIILVPEGFLVDHINGDTLDCRRHNLRVASHSQNRANQSGFGQYIGVSKVTPGRWRARCAGEHLGYYSDPRVAARARDVRALQIYGPYVKTNFDPPGWRLIRQELRAADFEDIPF